MTAPEPVPAARPPETPTSAPLFTILAAGGAGVCEGEVCQVPPPPHAPGEESPVTTPDER
jgi:hypothetical protein